MQFTPQEMSLIEKLRKQERQWRWLRWALLASSLSVLGCYGYIGVSLYHRLHLGSTDCAGFVSRGDLLAQDSAVDVPCHLVCSLVFGELARKCDTRVVVEASGCTESEER